MAAVLVAAILDGVLGLILDHIPALTLPFDYTVFLTVLVLVWYILTELGGIVENAGRAGSPFACMAVQGYCSAGVRRGQYRR